MEVRLRDQAAGAAELKVQVDQYKRRVIEVEGEAAAAEDVSAPEHDRIRADNRRLVARVVHSLNPRSFRSRLKEARNRVDLMLNLHEV